MGDLDISYRKKRVEELTEEMRARFGPVETEEELTEEEEQETLGGIIPAEDEPSAIQPDEPIEGVIPAEGDIQDISPDELIGREGIIPAAEYPELYRKEKFGPYGLREDGTKKDIGFLGEVKTPTGEIMTEMSIGVNLDGQEMLIPALVPTLTPEEVQLLAESTEGQEIPETVINKAVEHAEQRIAEGMNPFYSSTDDDFLAAVGEFIQDAPKQALAGVADAINNTLETAKDLGISVGIPDIGIRLTDKEGQLDLGLFGIKEAEMEGRTAKVIPVPEKGRTLGVNMVRAIAEFATGFIPARKLLGAAGVSSRVIKDILGAGIARGIVVDPEQERLTTLLNKVPVLKAIIPDYLADTNPENEGKWEKRIKDALDEMLVVGAGEAAIKSATKMLRLYKDATKISALVHGEEAAMEALKAQKEEILQPTAKATTRGLRSRQEPEDVPGIASQAPEIDPVEVGEKVEKYLNEPGWSDVPYQIYINSLLSSPTTHIGNAISNSATTVLGVGEKYLSDSISIMVNKTLGGRSSTGYFEANAKAMGFINGLREVPKMLRSPPAAIEAGTKLENFRGGALRAKLKIHVPKKIQDLPISGGQNFGQGLDYLASAIDMPSTALQKADVFFKALNYRMQIYEEAAKKVLAEGGDALTDPKLFREKMAKLVANPTDPMDDVAVDFARYQTFTGKAGKWTLSMQEAVKNTPMGRYVVPFISTPANLFKYSFDRTPLAWLAKSTRDQFRQGGASAEMVTAKMAAGSIIMALATFGALDGKISGSGPRNRSERNALLATGWQPYSVRVGDKWVSYARLEPFASLLAFPADASEIMAQLSDEDRDNVIAMFITAFSKQLANKTFVSGAIRLLDAISSQSPHAFESWSQQFLTAGVPPGNLGRFVTHSYTDDIKRDYRPDNEMHFLKSTMMRLRENYLFFPNDEAAPLRDVWGKPMKWDKSFPIPVIENVLPIPVKTNETDPVNRMIAEKRIGISRPKRQILGVTLSNHEYSEYSRIAGERLKTTLDRIFGTKDKINRFNDFQIQMIVNKTASESREYARKILLRQTPELQQRVTDEAKKLQLEIMGK